MCIEHTYFKEIKGNPGVLDGRGGECFNDRHRFQKSGCNVLLPEINAPGDMCICQKFW